MMIFYNSRINPKSLLFLWFLSNVANSVKTKVLYKSTPVGPISEELS